MQKGILARCHEKKAIRNRNGVDHWHVFCKSGWGGTQSPGARQAGVFSFWVHLLLWVLRESQRGDPGAGVALGGKD